MSNSREGICKLTNRSGKLVSSHILPKALTRAEGLGPGLTQYGNGKSQRRRSSWYDQALVTEEGEKILSDLDNWGIATLRRYKLVWSGWGPMQTLGDVKSFPGTPWGLRRIEFENDEVPRHLRVFLLSLLWRAAATDRSEFSEIDLPPDQIELLRRIVLDGNWEPLGFFPASLTQLSTIGLRHNHAPLAMTKEIPAIGDEKAWKEPIFRFFLDGLIIHFSRLSIEENDSKNLDTLRIGNSKSLTVSTVRSEESAQFENLRIIMAETALGRPLYEIPSGPFSPKRKIPD